MPTESTNEQKTFAFKIRITDLYKLNLVKLGYGGLALGLSQYSILPQLPQKMTLASKVVKSDSKIIILPRWVKSVTHSVEFTYITK